MRDEVKIVECPRDAWQGLPAQIPTQAKADSLRALIDAGFTHIDAVSFVSPASVPQMSDSEQVLALLKPPAGVEIIGIMVNERGAQRAIATGAVSTLGFPYSVSPAFLKRNQNQTPQESLGVLRSIASLAKDGGLGVVAYISMAFGNPYGDAWSVDAVTEACAAIASVGVKQISLADTVGLATPEQVGEVLKAVGAGQPEIELGVHLHARRTQAATRIRAAYEAGCRRFDAALGGLGGCPFAQDDLVGNIPTEVLLATLADCRATLPDLGPLDGLIRSTTELVKQYGETQQHEVARRAN